MSTTNSSRLFVLPPTSLPHRASVWMGYGFVLPPACPIATTPPLPFTDAILGKFVVVDCAQPQPAWLSLWNPSTFLIPLKTTTDPPHGFERGSVVAGALLGLYFVRRSSSHHPLIPDTSNQAALLLPFSSMTAAQTYHRSSTTAP